MAVSDSKAHGYQNPQTGVLALFPARLVPFLQLARIDRPYGLVYFSVPFISGLLHAGLILQLSGRDLILNAAKVILCSFFLRITACAWNDIIDAPFDRQVTRTRHRPLARRAMTVGEAQLASLSWGLAWIGSLRLMEPTIHVYALVAGSLWLVYPFLKRITHFPQVFLSFLQAWNVLMGMAMIGADPVGLSGLLGNRTNPLIYEVSGLHAQSVGYHFVAYFAWQLVFDTIYGFQDIDDDKKVGVKSTAIFIEAQAKPVLMLAAMMMVVSLVATGWAMNAGLVFFVGSVFGGGACCMLSVWNVDLRDSASCHYCFTSGGLNTGLAILSGLLGELVSQRMGLDY